MSRLLNVQESKLLKVFHIIKNHNIFILLIIQLRIQKQWLFITCTNICIQNNNVKIFFRYEPPIQRVKLV